MNKEQFQQIEMERDEKGKFVPGKSGNPNGRPKVSIPLRALKFIDQKRLEQAFRLVSVMKFSEVKEILETADNPECPYDMFELGVMSIWSRIVTEGDEKRFETVLNRMIGVNFRKYLPTKDQEDLVKNYLSLPREERQKEIERLDKLAQEVGDE